MPLDDGDTSVEALREAIAMVAAPSDVVALHVLPSLDTESDFVRAALDFSARAEGAESVLRARVNTVSNAVEVMVRTGAAGDVIAGVAEELGCDLIVIPFRARSGVSRFFLGSVTERVLRRARCSVLVHHAPGD